MGLVDFLRARLDEDEAAARAAADQLGGLSLGGGWRYDGRCVEATRERDMVAVGSQDFMEPEIGDHIARHDPARVLAEVEGKRRLLEDLRAELHYVNPDDGWHTCAAATEDRDGGSPDQGSGSCDCGRDDRVARRLRLLSLPYAGHPDYREDWRP